ncbi:hypothetical protein [Desulfonatronum thioautotrophicum]|uniref:hypothetical protein n=1 Tax=Desulfonatronum thioautotrophicum TaxID=617001 RepID=UPI00069A393A|nr:hypothetical protein [Desulfonatronum thioautotrophicum]
MNILVVHNPVTDGASPADADVMDQVQAVATALAGLGHDVQILDWPRHLCQARSLLTEQRPEMVFNLVESLEGSARSAHLVPALLEEMKIPFTGGSASALQNSTSKLLVKSVLHASGLPGPLWLDNQGGGSACFPGVYIVKSVWEHASHALESDNVLRTSSPTKLLEAIEQHMAQLGGEWFAEVYIPGREFSLAMIEEAGVPRFLCPAEMVFTGYPAEMPKVVGYRAKWLEQSFEYQNTIRRQKFSGQDMALLDSLRALAHECWLAFELSGYARVDFRVDAHNQPWVIDVNANPCLSPDAGYQAAALASGVGFKEIMERLLQAASRQFHAFHGGRLQHYTLLSGDVHLGTDHIPA